VKTEPKYRRANAAPSDTGIRIAWNESLRFCGPHPETYKRFYKLETLKNAVEKAIGEKDRFLFTGIQKRLAGGAPGVIKCTLVYEDANRLVFSVFASNRMKKQAVLRLVIAKNHEECSAQLLAEYETLRELHGRAPHYVIEPFAHGVVYLPDRHHRREVNRELFGYMTAESVGMAPLYVASGTQLAPHDTRPLCYSKKDTDKLKLTIIRLAISLYDDAAATGMDPALLYPECIAAPENGKSADRILLLQCRQIRKRFYRHKLIHNLLFGFLKTGAKVMPLAPVYPGDFLDALCAVVPHETAKAWCSAFLEKHRTMDAHEHEELLPGREYLDVLKELVSAD